MELELVASLDVDSWLDVLGVFDLDRLLAVTSVSHVSLRCGIRHEKKRV